MLKYAVKPVQTSAVSTAARPVSPLGGIAAPKRSVKCHFREEERARQANPYNTSSSSSGGGGYYSGYNEDPFESLREGAKDLKAKWDEWPAEDRNSALIYGSGGLLALYIANAVLDAVERVPLVPGLLKFVGLLFSSWFFYRYLLFADGRSDLARNLTLDKIFSRVDDRVDDLSNQAAGAMNRARKSTGNSGSSSSRTSRGTSAYGASELDQNVSNALHDMEKIADDLRD
jgi:hypothetical protein